MQLEWGHSNLHFPWRLVGLFSVCFLLAVGAAGFFSFVMTHHFGGASVETGRAAAYSAIILCQFINILSRRTERTIFTSYLFTNKQLWASFLISIIAVLILIYPKSVSVWFGFAPMSLHNWIYPAIGALVFLFWHETRKAFGVNKL